MEKFQALIAEIERNKPLKEGVNHKNKFKQGDIVYGSGSTSRCQNVKYPLTVVKARGDGTYILGSFTEKLSSSGLLYYKAPFVIQVDEKDIALDTLIEEEDTFSRRINEGGGEVIFTSICKYTLKSEHDIDDSHTAVVIKNEEGYLSLKTDGRIKQLRYAEDDLCLHLEDKEEQGDYYNVYRTEPLEEVKKIFEEVKKSNKKLKESINEINPEKFIEIPLKFAPRHFNWDAYEIYGFIKNKETSVMEIEELKKDYKEEEGEVKFSYAFLNSSIGKRNIVIKYKNDALVFFNVEEGDLEIKNIETANKRCYVSDGVYRSKRNFPPVVVIPTLENMETFKI